MGDRLKVLLRIPKTWAPKFVTKPKIAKVHPAQREGLESPRIEKKKIFRPEDRQEN